MAETKWIAKVEEQINNYHVGKIKQNNSSGIKLNM